MKTYEEYVKLSTEIEADNPERASGVVLALVIASGVAGLAFMDAALECGVDKETVRKINQKVVAMYARD